MQVEVNGARLFFDTVGSALAIDGERMAQRPTMLVLHGGPGFDHSVMRPYFDRFADTHQIIYLDHRGNGRSEGADGWTLDQWADDIAGFCRVLGIDRPVIYGLSFGGMVAMAYASRHPDGPSKVILASTAGRMDLPATYAAMERLGGAQARRIAEAFWSSPSADKAAEYMSVCLPLYNPSGALGDDDARKRAIMRTEVMFHFIEHEQAAMDLLPGLAAVTCPALVLAGALDPITPPGCSQAIHAALPPGRSELVVFDDAGHGVHRDQPDRAEAVIRAFLAA